MNRIWVAFFSLVLLLFGVATSHAALYFPHFDTRTNQWQTEICIINPSATDLVVGTLETYSSTGTPLGTESGLVISPNNRKQFSVGVGTDLAYAANTKGYIVFKNLSGAPVGYTKFTQTGGDRVAVPAADVTATDAIYLTHIAWAPWWTGISLVNTTDTAKTLTFRFNTGKTKQVTLGAKEQYVKTIAELNDNLIDTAITSAVIEGASGVVGLELFGNGPQLGGVPLISQMATTLYYPHVDTSTGWWTGIAAYNPSATATAQVTVNAYDTGGNLLQTSTLTIGPRQNLVRYSTDPIFNLPAGTKWFSMQSANPLVGFELFGNSSPNYLAGYSVVNLQGRSGIFSKVEKAANGWTGIAFVNTEDQQARVSIKAYDDNGNLIAPGNKTLKAHEKWVGYPVDQNSNFSLFPPGTNLNAATYISFSADRSVAGFQLNSAGVMLDALQTAAPSGQKILDQALGLLQYQSTATSGLTAVTDIIDQIGGSGVGGTCPQVTTNPPTINPAALPSAITITASYGNGCTPPPAPDGTTVTMSGEVLLYIYNLSVGSDFSSISLDYSLAATNVQQNGKILLHGYVSGNIAFANSQLNASAHFGQLPGSDSAITISGDMTITANIAQSGGAYGGNIAVSFDNLAAAGYTVTSGTLTLSSASGSMTGQVEANLNTSQGSVNISMTSEKLSNTRYTFSTPTPGTIAGYTVTLDNVTMDSACSNNPLAGSVAVSAGGSTVSRTFNATCVPVAATPVSVLREVTHHVTRVLTPSNGK